MKAVFVELPAFERFRAKYLDDDAFRELQTLLMLHPRLATKFPIPVVCASCASVMRDVARVNVAA